MMTRTRKPDVSETDVSLKKMKIQKKKTGSPEVTRVAVMPSQNVSTFQKRWVAVLQGSRASLRNLVGRHTDATQFLELHNIMLLPLYSGGANILKVVTG